MRRRGHGWDLERGGRRKLQPKTGQRGEGSSKPLFSARRERNDDDDDDDDDVDLTVLLFLASSQKTVSSKNINLFL